MLPRMKVPLQLVCFFLVAGCGGVKPIEDVERRAVRSPGGRQEARRASYDLGKTTRVQNVYIVPQGFSGKLSALDSVARVAASVQDCRDDDLEVRWLTDERLVVVFRQERPSWVNYVPYVAGVAIEIENRSKAPNQSLEPTTTSVTPPAAQEARRP